MRTTTLLLLFILLFILCFTPKLSLALVNNTIISVSETVIQSASFQDDTVLLRLVAALDGCSKSQVELILVNRNGTILNNGIIKDSKIPGLNFCVPSANRQAINGITQDGIRIHALQSQPRFILLTYGCESNSLELCGLLINQNYEVIGDEINLGQKCTTSSIVSHNDGEFLRACYLPDQVIWTTYFINNQTINLKDTGNIITLNENSFSFSTGSGYGIVIYRPDQLTLFLYFISSSSSSPSSYKVRGPYLLYRPTQTGVTSLTIFKCGISNVDLGYNCLISTNTGLFVNIDFLDSGSIMATNEFSINPNPTVPLNVINVDSLSYGGYLLLISQPNTNIVNGLIYSNNGVPYKLNWEMPLTIDGVSMFYTGIFGVFTDNTIWTVTRQGVRFITSDLLTNYYASTNQNSIISLKTFGNPFIASTNPLVNVEIDPISTISITFTNLIELSTGNVSIWQFNGNGHDTLRQSFSGSQSQFINLENDSKTITITIFDSTFNIPGGQYYVKIDDNFVIDLRTGQNLPGIKGNRWYFETKIIDPSQEINTGSDSVIIRLTPDGTTYFRSLSDSKRSDFSKEMSQELSNIIPIDPARLFTTEKFQYDPNTEKDQALFRVDVKGLELIGVDNSISSTKVVDNLNTLIKNKEFTGIDRDDCSNMLDSTFGGVRAPDLWKKYKLILAGVGALLAILIILFLFANRKEGRNYIIFLPTIIIIDFVLDILFIIIHGHDFKWLYPTSVVIFSFPLLVNFIVTFLITTRETKPSNTNDNKEFRKWWRNNPKTALFFTLFSIIDIEGLNIISSGYSGYDRFNAPISDESSKRILFFNAVVKIIEDIPQLIIYVSVKQMFFF